MEKTLEHWKASLTEVPTELLTAELCEITVKQDM